MDNVIPLKREPAVPEPRTVTTQEAVMIMLADRRGTGATWKEVGTRYGLHHGAASGALSRLHANGSISRLSEHRDGCAVYVLPEWVEERRVEARRMPRQGLLDDMARMLTRVYRGCAHDPDLPHPTCKQCDIRFLLDRYQREVSH